MSIFDQVKDVLSNIVATQAPVTTAGATPALTQLEIRWATRVEAIQDERDRRYRLYQSYYDGQHRDPRKLAFGDATDEPTDDVFSARHNFLDVCIDVPVERLRVTGFSVEGDGLTPDQSSTVAQTLWRWWQGSRMDEHAITIHAQSMIKGDAYVMAAWDNDQQAPCFHVQDALEVTPVYDSFHHMNEAFKAWVERLYLNGGNRLVLRRRITRYQSGEIAKFYADDGFTFLPYTGDIDPATGASDNGVIDWSDPLTGDPLPIPIIHFPNRPRGNDFGHSDIADLIPFQDELNRRIWNGSEAGSYQGAAQRFIINGQLPRDDKGNIVQWQSGPGTVIAIQPANTSAPVMAGQFAPGDLGAIEDATDRHLKRMASKARVPLHLIWPEGGLPSGESLKTAEAPLISKCSDRSVALGNRWEDLMKLAIRLHNAFSGEEPIRTDLTITTEWAPFEMRSELSTEQAISLRRDDISRRQANRERGYTDEEIDRMDMEREDETPPALRQIDQFGGQHPDNLTAAMQQLMRQSGATPGAADNGTG